MSVRVRGVAVFLFLIVLAALLPAQGGVAPSKGDPDAQWRAELESALSDLGLKEEQLGYRPKDWWTAFPRMSQLPFLQPHFRDLFAEPLATPLFTRSLGAAVRRYLPPLPTEARKKQKGDRLRKLIYFLGVERMITGFRPYSANLSWKPREKEPLLEACVELLRRTGHEERIVTFGKETDWPRPREELAKKIEAVPQPLRRPLAQLLLSSLEAWTWTERGTAKVEASAKLALHAALDLGETQGDGNKFYPEIEAAWKKLDLHSLSYGAMKAAEALEVAEFELADAMSKAGAKKPFTFDWKSPLGRIRFSGTGADTHDLLRSFLVVDLGGNDSWKGRIAANAPDQSLSLALDLDGDDRYTSRRRDVPSQGVGILGCGILLDARGKDRYESESPGQGMGQLGIGVLLDRHGADQYKARYSAQGVGFLGIGLCLDAEGKDAYSLLAEGQGFGCIGGVGVLADASGDDSYLAEPDAGKAGRGDYHSGGGIAVSNAQGVGSGRRGDGSDGRSYAGGLGLLADLSGNDHYRAGNFSLGCGYWFGTGLVYEGEGDDFYDSCYFTQASGAHFAIGAILDEKGDDRHILFETAGAGIAFGWDFVNAILVDLKGNDRYEAKIISIASSMVRSNAFLIDVQGDDVYLLDKKRDKDGNSTTVGYGRCDLRANYEGMTGPVFFSALTRSVAVLLDLGGRDRYLERGKDGTQTALPALSDGKDRKLIDAAKRTHAIARDR